jgi:hypothetical protein
MDPEDAAGIRGLHPKPAQVMLLPVRLKVTVTVTFGPNCHLPVPPRARA